MEKKHTQSEEKISKNNMTQNTRKVKSLPWSKIFLYGALTATIVGALYSTKVLSGVEKKIAEAKEMARPANVKLTKITTSDCNDCFNLEDAVAVLKKQNIKVDGEKTVAFNSREGKALIKELGIKRLPTYIINGEIKKKNLVEFIKSNGSVTKNSFIFTKVPPVFIDTVSQKPQGKVSVTYLLDSSCTQCIDPKYTIEALQKAGVKITDQKELEWNSAEGQSLISKYNITKVPAFILSPEMKVYDNIKKSFSQIGTIEQDGSYIARNISLPYRDIEKGQVTGLVDLIYLTDSTCTECYKPGETHRSILTQGFGVGLRSERTVDVNSPEGQNLISQYKIINVPTILVSPDADQYPNLKAQWVSVGTVESDGWYVFREIKAMGTMVYKNLKENKIMNLVTPTVTKEK